jgi:hypothetical protein
LNEAASRRYTSVMAAYLWELDTALKTHGIEMPFPQRELRVRSLFGMEGPAALAALRGEVEPAGLPAAPPAPPLPARERETLARNDAQADTERQIREEAAERAARPASDGDDADADSGSGAAP